MKIARKEPTVLTDIDSYMRGFVARWAGLLVNIT